MNWNSNDTIVRQNGEEQEDDGSAGPCTDVYERAEWRNKTEERIPKLISF